MDLDGIGLTAQESLILSNKLRTQIVKSGIYTVLDRSEMKNILKEQGFQQTGCTSSECAVEVGQILGVSQMLSGSVGKLGDVYYIEVKLIDVTTSRILQTADEVVSGAVSDILVTGIPAVVAKLTGYSLPQSNYIASNSEQEKVEITDNWGSKKDVSLGFGDSVLLVTMDYGDILNFEVEPESRQEVDKDISESLESTLQEALGREIDIAIISHEELKNLLPTTTNILIRQRVLRYTTQSGYWGDNVETVAEYGFFKTPQSRAPVFSIKVEEGCKIEGGKQQTLMDLFEELEDVLEEDLESYHRELSKLDYR